MRSNVWEMKLIILQINSVVVWRYIRCNKNILLHVQVVKYKITIKVVLWTFFLDDMVSQIKIKRGIHQISQTIKH